jgi:2-polyprenyl-3-methyl-5-hydroxy-6-metoxy-1,4-benzoquinol methylase
MGRFSVPELKSFGQRITGGHIRCADYVVNRIRQDLGEIDCLMDVGCGTMTTTKAIAGRLPETRIVGCDIHNHSPKSLDYPPNLEYRRIEPYSVASLHLNPDVITLNGVVHHIPHDREEEFMADIHTALKPNGNLLIHEHQLAENRIRRRIEYWQLCFSEFMINRLLERMSSSYNFFTRERLRRLLERNGFGVLNIEDTGHRFVTLPSINTNMALWCEKK